MLNAIFSELLNTFTGILNVILYVLSIFVAIAIALVAYKKYRQAIFLENPNSNTEFQAFYQNRHDNYKTEHEAAKDFLNFKKLAAEYELLHASDIKKQQLREQKQQRKDAYYYLKSLDLNNVKLDEHQYDYVGYDPHHVAQMYYQDDDYGDYYYDNDLEYDDFGNPIQTR